MRKHKDVLYPTKAFKLLDFIGAFENILYNVVLNFKWYFYLVFMLTFYRPLFFNIFITNILLYTVSNIFKFIVYSWYRQKSHIPMSYFLIYLPCMVFYFGMFLRIVRTIAYVQEIFFKRSYSDPWNPAKTSLHAKHLGL